VVETGSNVASTAALMANVKGGNDSIAIGSTTKTVAHGIAAGAPSGYSVTPSVDSTGVDIYVTSVDATNLYVAMDFVQESTVYFSWTAIR
jgi:hypothetical protein